MKIRYTPRALAELDSISTYIAEWSPRSAEKVRRRLQSTVAKLALFPFMGAPTNISDLRRIVTTPYPYVVFYQVTGDEVAVIAVRHAARRPLHPGGYA